MSESEIKAEHIDSLEDPTATGVPPAKVKGYLFHSFRTFIIPTNPEKKISNSIYDIFSSIVLQQ